MFHPENIENEFFLKLDFSFSASDLAKGKVLISEPFLEDPNFNRSVVLLTEYVQEEGAFGFVLNRPTDLFMHDIIEDFPCKHFPFHYGGPVENESLFFIHQLGDALEDSREIFPGLWWSGNFDHLRSLISTGSVQEHELKFFGGYSGWEAGQLERELMERSWIMNTLSRDHIFKTPADQMWRESLRSLGSKFSVMSQFPENPGMN